MFQQNNIFGKPQAPFQNPLSNPIQQANPFQPNPIQTPFTQQQQNQQPLFQQTFFQQQPIFQQNTLQQGFNQPYQQSLQQSIQQPITAQSANDFQALQNEVVNYQPSTFYQKAIHNQYNEEQIIQVRQQVRSEHYKQSFTSSFNKCANMDIQHAFDSLKAQKFPEALVKKFDFGLMQRSSNEDTLMARQIKLFDEAQDFVKGLAVIDKGAHDFNKQLDEISKETEQCNEDANQINQYLQKEKQIGAPRQKIEFPHSAHLKCLHNQRNQLRKIAENLDAQIKLFQVTLGPHKQDTIRYSQLQQIVNYFDLLKVRIKNIEDRVNQLEGAQITFKEAERNIGAAMPELALDIYLENFENENLFE